MKVFVGTLYSGENEFTECLESIQRQNYHNYQQFIFKDLPNKAAHVTLFNSFLERAGEFDILIKVDADMVLANDFLFENIVKKMQTDNDIDIFSIAVYDFFSDQLIHGLNAYRNTLRWDNKNELVFVDFPSGHYKVIFDDKVLAPAAVHCKNPSPLQAFHYGVHRGVKAIQPKGGSSHWASLNRASRNFHRCKDVRIGLAVLGAELAYAGMFEVANLDYADLRLKERLVVYELWNAYQIEREIRRLRLINWGFLPDKFRRKMLILINQNS